MKEKQEEVEISQAQATQNRKECLANQKQCDNNSVDAENVKKATTLLNECNTDALYTLSCFHKNITQLIRREEQGRAALV